MTIFRNILKFYLYFL